MRTRCTLLIHNKYRHWTQLGGESRFLEYSPTDRQARQHKTEDGVRISLTYLSSDARIVPLILPVSEYGDE